MMPLCLNYLLCSWFSFDGFRGPSQSWGGDGGGVEGGPAPSSQLIKKKKKQKTRSCQLGHPLRATQGNPERAPCPPPAPTRPCWTCTEAFPCRQGQEVWHGFPNTRPAPSTRLREKSLPGVFVTAGGREAGKRICIFQVPAMSLAESRDCKI